MPQQDDESEVVFLKKQLEASVTRNDLLVKQNQELRQEITRLTAQVSSLKAHNNERKSMLWKKLQKSVDGTYNEALPQKPSLMDNNAVKHGNPAAVKKPSSRPDYQESPAGKEPLQQSKPQPKPNSTTNRTLLAPPPPPPPLKSVVGSKAIRRVPEVLELYRSLTRRDAQKEGKSNTTGLPAMAFTKNMIGEIENRSAYLSAIKSDVEAHGEFINFLIKEVESAAYKEISDVETFVKWLDKELSSLVDERAVLKHFPNWPERKADALREAAFSYRDTKNLETEISCFEDNPKEQMDQVLRRAQTLQDRLEQSINNMERMRDGVSKKYKDFQIPWEWMMDTGLIGQMKLSSTRLAKEYMKRITQELQSNECSQDKLLLQGVRFAYRVHQEDLMVKQH